MDLFLYHPRTDNSENLGNIGGASYGHDIRKFERKLMHLQMLCGGLPTNKL
jgi:hypothetical protein